LKPENIIIENKTGILKLIDFGFAKRLQPQKERTMTKCGTPIYTAPEIISLNNESKEELHAYSYSVDIWSWGVLLCELIGGFNPFYSSDVMQIYENIIK
jgi:protein kinase A